MDADSRVTMAQESLRLRALRGRYFPGDLFAEYAWVMLLHAYLRHAGAAIATEGEPTPALGAPVMRHWRRYLEQQELVEPAPADRPPVLTPAALDRMERYLDDLARTARDLG